MHAALGIGWFDFQTKLEYSSNYTGQLKSSDQTKRKNTSGVLYKLNATSNIKLLTQMCGTTEKLGETSKKSISDHQQKQVTD